MPNPVTCNMLAGFGNEMLYFQQQNAYQFENDFPRLALYSEIEYIRSSFEPLMRINRYVFSEVSMENSRFFIIRSSTHDDIHKSMKYGVWTSTYHNNVKLNSAFNEISEANNGGRVFLIFRTVNLNVSCGIAVLTEALRPEHTFPLWWDRSKFKGTFKVQWAYVKNIDLQNIQIHANGKKIYEMIDGTE